MSNPPALLLRGQMPTSYLAREPSAIPAPATTASPVPNLNFSLERLLCAWFACEVCVCVCVFFFLFFLVFLYHQVELKGPKSLARKRPGHTVNALGLLLRLPSHSAIGGVHSHDDGMRATYRYIHTSTSTATAVFYVLWSWIMIYHELCMWPGTHVFIALLLLCCHH